MLQHSRIHLGGNFSQCPIGERLIGPQEHHLIVDRSLVKMGSGLWVPVLEERQ